MRAVARLRQPPWGVMYGMDRVAVAAGGGKVKRVEEGTGWRTCRKRRRIQGVREMAPCARVNAATRRSVAPCAV